MRYMILKNTQAQKTHNHSTLIHKSQDQGQSKGRFVRVRNN